MTAHPTARPYIHPSVLLLVLFGLWLAAQPALAAPSTPTYELPVAPLQLVTDEAAFRPFAERVYRDAGKLLIAQPPPDAARLKLVLGLRVHLALHFGDSPAALDAAERIRALQTDPAERALAGLTTQAVVQAKATSGASSGPVFAAAFERRFTQLLRDLPRDAAIRAALIRGRERSAAIEKQILLKDAQTLATRLKAGDRCSLEEADQLIRIRHRLESIVPLRDAMLRSYDAAIAHQSAQP